jgi:CheY-like chemotaxis protein/HPt (histidine-containing phosphotransfer) domain-containing protein
VDILDPEEGAHAEREVAEEDDRLAAAPSARVLVADDALANRKLISLVLRRAGLEVETAENGQVAVELAAKGGFDLVLMDMEMPTMDGYEATRRLRKQGLTIPIFALTAHAMEGCQDECEAAGCSGFLTKPIDMDVLVQTVAETLGAAHGRAADRSATAGAPITASRASASGAIADGGRGAPTQRSTSALPADPGGSSSGAHCSSRAEPPLTARPIELVSSLPTEDPEFREIVEEFVERLGERWDVLLQAWQEGDLEELASLAHWLKGAGGTAGFRALTDPAENLIRLAKAGETGQIDAAIAELADLTNKIVAPAAPSGVDA